MGRQRPRNALLTRPIPFHNHAMGVAGGGNQPEAVLDSISTAVSTGLRGRTQFESWLGRSLVADECAPVASVAELTAPQLAVVRQLAAGRLTRGIAYLLAVTASPVRDILLYARQL